jgi:hypothetical protein
VISVLKKWNDHQVRFIFLPIIFYHGRRLCYFHMLSLISLEQANILTLLIKGCFFSDLKTCFKKKKKISTKYHNFLLLLWLIIFQNRFMYMLISQKKLQLNTLSYLIKSTHLFFFLPWIACLVFISKAFKIKYLLQINFFMLSSYFDVLY